MFDGIDPFVRPFFIGAEAWPSFATRVRPHLQTMAEGSGGRYLREDIETAIVAGDFQLWAALDGPEIVCVMLTQLMTYPRFRALRCIAIVGHRPRRWMGLLTQVEQAAKLNFGCERMEALHQPRHGTLLKRSPGWTEFHILSEKTL